MQQPDTLLNHSWRLSYRGRVAVFIDGNNLFHAARYHTLDIDYNKLLQVLLGDGRLLRAFFYTGVDTAAGRQQGFLLWMRRNGFRVVQKQLKTFYDGSRKANLDVEIAVDMLSLAGSYDTAVLVSGDEDFVYAVNAVAYKGCRVEIAGFRSNTAPKLIDVADYFIDLGEIADRIRKDTPHTARCYEQLIREAERTGEIADEIYAVAPPHTLAPDDLSSNLNHQDLSSHTLAPDDLPFAPDEPPMMSPDYHQHHVAAEAEADDIARTVERLQDLFNAERQADTNSNGESRTLISVTAEFIRITDD